MLACPCLTLSVPDQQAATAPPCYRYNQHAAAGLAGRKLWLVPCRVDAQCSDKSNLLGCACGKYAPDGSQKPAAEQWQQIVAPKSPGRRLLAGAA